MQRDPETSLFRFMTLFAVWNFQAPIAINSKTYRVAKHRCVWLATHATFVRRSQSYHILSWKLLLVRLKNPNPKLISRQCWIYMIDVSQEFFGKLPQIPFHEKKKKKKKKRYLLEWKKRILLVKDRLHCKGVKLYRRLFQFSQGNKIYRYLLILVYHFGNTRYIYICMFVFIY